MKRKFIIILLFITGTIYSQDELLTNPYKGYVFVGTDVTTWKIGEGWANTITQMIFPLQVVFPVNSRFNFTIIHSPAVTWGYVKEETILGLSDTWVKGSYMLWENRAVFNVGIGIPTGKTRLNEYQYNMSKGTLIRNVFKYPLPVYGQGFCARIGLVTAHPVRDGLILGFGIQYLLRSAYHPVKYEYSYATPGGGIKNQLWDVAYRPGDEVGANIGVDIKIRENMKILLDAIYTYYWRDMLDGMEIFGSGSKLNLSIGYYWEYEQKYLWSYLLYRRRGKNELLQGLSIQQEQQYNSGDQFEFNTLWQPLIFPNGAFAFTGDTRYYVKNELYTGPDLVFGLGIKTYYRLGMKTTAHFRFKFEFGTVLFNNKRNVAGLVTSLGFKYDL